LTPIVFVLYNGTLRILDIVFKPRRRRCRESCTEIPLVSSGRQNFNFTKTQAEKNTSHVNNLITSKCRQILLYGL